MATRQPSGWASEALNVGQGAAANANVSVALGNPYKAFSADLCQGWFVQVPEPLLDPPRDFEALAQPLPGRGLRGKRL